MEQETQKTETLPHVHKIPLLLTIVNIVELICEPVGANRKNKREMDSKKKLINI